MDPASSASVGHHRTTSYDRGDEYRDFSSGSHMSPSGQSQINNMDGSSNTRFNPMMTSPGGMAPVAGVSPNQQYYASGPPLHVQTNAPTYHQPQRGYGDLSSGTRQSSATSWGQSPLAESASNLDPQQRRDFTPSAMPQPSRVESELDLPPPDGPKLSELTLCLGEVAEAPTSSVGRVRESILGLDESIDWRSLCLSSSMRL